MNLHQQLAHKRLERRFSSGDGVRLVDGRTGVVRGHNGKGGYCVEVVGEAMWVNAPSDGLESVPELNTGKYGGPSRGGAPGGYTGGNNYRAAR